MGDHCENFQLVRGRKFRNKSKNKNLKLPTVDHCDESTNIPAKLPRLLTSIQNCRLELDESNFRKDFEATVSKAGILASVTEGSTGDTSRSNSHPIERVVSYGIGNYSTCPIARYQFAFLSILCELLKIEKKNCFVYDPRFSSLEREGVLNCGFQLIDVNEEGKRRSEERTLFYMLHCGKALYNNLVWANWNPVHLYNTIIIGNSFTGMSESLPEKEFKTELYCISKAMPLMKEFSIPNTFVHKDIFNNTSLHIFCVDVQQGKMMDEDQVLWPMIEEPKYTDCEIITAQPEQQGVRPDRGRRVRSAAAGQRESAQDDTTGHGFTGEVIDKASVVSADEVSVGSTTREKENAETLSNQLEKALNFSSPTECSSEDARRVSLGQCICGQPGTSRCSRCLLQSYCSKPCQRKHWALHKANCINVHVEFVMKHFQKYQMYGCSLIASIILVERLRQYGIVAYIKDGYYVIPGVLYAGRHIWVENKNGIQFDIGLRITNSVLPQTASIKYMLVGELPSEVTRIDNETAKEREDLRDLEIGITMVRDRKIEEIIRKAPKKIQKIYTACVQSESQ